MGLEFRRAWLHEHRKIGLTTRRRRASHGAAARCIGLADDFASVAGRHSRTGVVSLVHSVDGPSATDGLDSLTSSAARPGFRPSFLFWDSGAAVARLCGLLGIGEVHVHAHSSGTVRGLTGANWPSAQANPGMLVPAFGGGWSPGQVGQEKASPHRHWRPLEDEGERPPGRQRRRRWRAARLDAFRRREAEAAPDAFEARISNRLEHPAFSVFGTLTVAKDEALAWADGSSFDSLTEEERRFAASLHGNLATPTLWQRNWLPGSSGRGHRQHGCRGGPQDPVGRDGRLRSG